MMSNKIAAIVGVTTLVNPLAGLILEAVTKAAKLVDTASDKGVSELKDEVDKESIRLQFALQQARIAQELAIARRIEMASEVEIEEFYDNSGKGNIGANFDATAKTMGLGVGAEGRFVTKRVYHFRGGALTEEAIEAELA